jgi:tetratricopeptide (TPR) repeat protein
MSSNQSNKPPTKPATGGIAGKPGTTVPGLGASPPAAARTPDKSSAGGTAKPSQPGKEAAAATPALDAKGAAARVPAKTLLGYASPSPADKPAGTAPRAAESAPGKPASAEKAAVADKPLQPAKPSSPRTEQAAVPEPERASSTPPPSAATPPTPPSRTRPGRAGALPPPAPPTRPKGASEGGSVVRAAVPPPTPPPVRRSTPPPPPKRTSVPPPPPTRKPASPTEGPSAGDYRDAPAMPSPEPPASPSKGLIETCKAELAVNPEPTRAVRLHYEIARAEGEPKVALEHYRKALALVPDHVPSLRGARRLLLQLGDVAAALPLFDVEVELTSDPQRCALLHYAKGRALEDITGDVKAARACFAQAAALDDANPAVLKALQQCELAAEDWANLERAREHEANAVAEDPAHRAALMVDRARMLETRLKDVESATELYQMALSLDGMAVGALSALKRLLYGQKRWRDLCAVLEREAEQATDPEVKGMALFRISRIYSERLGAEREAIDALVRALRVRPNDQLIVEELVRLYEPTDDTAGLARALEMLGKCVADDRQRLGILVRIAELFELRHGDDEKAIHWYEAARTLDPAHSPVVNALDALYSQHERWDALMAVRLAEADACTDSLRRANGHARVAEILETHMGRPDEAAAQHARALSLAAELESSFKALTRLYQRAGRHRDLVELYTRAIDRARDEDVVIAYLFKIGLLYEDALTAPGLAIQAYQRILRLRPDHLGAVHALQRSAEASMHHEVLVEALEREAELCKDRARVLSLLHRAGDVLADDVRDRDAALARYRKVLKLDGRYVPALASLGRLFHKMGRFRDMLQMQEQELEVTPEVSSKVALLVSMAETARGKLGDDERAIGYFRKAVELDATHVPGLHALEQLLHARRDWAGLVKVLEAELGGLDDPEIKARTAYRLGEVNEVHLRKLGAAVAAYAQAVQIVPGHRPSRDAIARVQTELGSWRELVRTLDQEAAATDDARLAIEALVRAGDVHRDLLSQPTDAITSFEAIITLDPENLAALLALEGLYRRAARWDDLAAVYGMQARVLKDRRARVAALEALARLLGSKLPDREEELRKAYAAILTADPGNSVALEGLERVALRQGDKDLLADIDSRSTKAETDPLMVAAHFTRLGESLEAGSTAAALASYRSALRRSVGSGAWRRNGARPRRWSKPRAAKRPGRATDGTRPISWSAAPWSGYSSSTTATARWRTHSRRCSAAPSTPAPPIV